MTSRCPHCKKPAAAQERNEWHPFCSERCRLIDLGRWIDGSHRIPGTPDPEQEPAPDEQPDTLH